MLLKLITRKEKIITLISLILFCNININNINNFKILKTTLITNNKIITKNNKIIILKIILLL